jgi:hypothetical protein
MEISMTDSIEEIPGWIHSTKKDENKGAFAPHSVK